ncbi:MAG: MinD/ParA family ATP-binding protein [bacterium]
MKKQTDSDNSAIWAIGGGKGGTGKSFILSAIASYLALTERKVILIDADMGGANLHSFLGINRPQLSLSNFFENKMPLAELIIKSRIKNLGLLTGTIHSLNSDNIKYTEKLKFFRHIKKLDTDYILIDLGAGAHYNTIDTFLLADIMLVMMIPEITAIENMYYFLKNVFCRKILNSLSAYGFKELVRQAWRDKGKYNIKTLKQFIDHLKGLSKTIEDIINSELANFTIHIILNQLKNTTDNAIGDSVKSICLKYFGFNAQYLGYIEYDSSVSTCMNNRQLYMQTCPSSNCAMDIKKVTDHILGNN